MEESPKGLVNMREEESVYYVKSSDGTEQTFTGYRHNRAAVSIVYREGKIEASYRPEHKTHYEPLEYPLTGTPPIWQDLSDCRVKALEAQLELLVGIAEAHIQQETLIRSILPKSLGFGEEVDPYRLQEIGEIIQEEPSVLVLPRDIQDKPREWKFKGKYKKQVFNTTQGRITCDVIFSPEGFVEAEALPPPNYPDYIYIQCRLSGDCEERTICVSRAIHHRQEFLGLLHEALSDHQEDLEELIEDLGKLRTECLLERVHPRS